MSSSAALIVPPSTSATRGPGGVAAGLGVQGPWLLSTSYVATRPPSRKAEAAVTASVTRPPESPRRSRTTPASDGTRATASRTCSPTPLVKEATLTTVGPSASVRTVTGSVDSRARCSSVDARVPRSRPSRTAVPAGSGSVSPRSMETTSATGRPSTRSPSTLRSRSPSRIPGVRGG
ncbi:hypothetical protein SVIOM342S_10600 [Streptomyces violaceorubidus]